MAIDKKMLSIDSEDDNSDIVAFNEFLEQDTERRKLKTISDIEKIGEVLLNEIDKKNRKREIKKQKQIPYILKYSGDKYDIEELNAYSFDDVQQIFNETQKKESTIKKIFHFIFNLT